MSQAGRDRQGLPAAHWGHQSITLYCSSSRTRWFCFDKRVLYHESVIGSYPQRVDTSPDPGMFDHMDRSYRSYIELGKLDGDGNEGVRKMQVLCKSSNEQPDTCCSVCGQGFVLFWERPTKTERAQALREVEKTIRSHHYNQAGPEAHPNRGFVVPEWKGRVAVSGAAILGNAPSWAL